MARKRLIIADHHRRWGIIAASLVGLVAVGIAGIAFARTGEINREPWGYIALAVAVLAALGGFFLALTMAVMGDSEPSDPDRSSRGGAGTSGQGRG
ncbi:MAG: hypothetical protein JWQ91_1830 [Aeromicrobium sp.]|jgi:hypothetical protein|uniref:hypothetical protein n=1 Tax=Aeromicrobium sp. TaxID=1871063 RepID=UPI002625925A|nr:hypothetical protein [Aeromicrobium sp.]MCW2824913.1 hypothetical protein [Aeromicrobium sp.]